MKSLRETAAVLLASCPLAHADGILSRYGTTDRSAATEILIIYDQT